MKKYKLNQRVDGEGGYFIGRYNFFMCFEAYAYITSFDDLQKAWEECNNLSYILRLTQFINSHMNTPNKYNYHDFMNMKEVEYEIVNNKEFILNEDCDNLFKEWQKLWIKIIKRIYNWKFIAPILESLEVIKEKEIGYELNITAGPFHSNDLRYVVLGTNMDVCRAAYDYIINSESLQAAWEECDESDFISYLFDKLNINFVSSSSYFAEREDEYDSNNVTHFEYLDDDAKDEFYMIWEEEWMSMIKKKYPWDRLKDILLKQNLIKEV